LISLHLFVISFPKDSFVFDEAFYIPAARDIINGVGSNPEHPFLGKAWISVGISLFGDNWFGWRIITTTFSILSLITFYYLSRFFISDKLATYSTLILGIDIIFFVHGSLALLEVPSIFFALLSFYFYFRKNKRTFIRIRLDYIFSTIFIALSFLSKETAAFYVIILVFLYISNRINYSKYKELFPKLLKSSFLLLLLIAIYVIPVSLYDQVYQPSSKTEVIISETEILLTDEQGIVTSTTTITNTTTTQDLIENAIEHLFFTVSYASGLTITNDSNVNYGNYAWNWILPVPSYPPSPYYVENAEIRHTTRANDEIIGITTETKHPIAWYGIGTLHIWWSIWIIVPIITYKIVKKKGKDIDYLILIWIAGTYLPMLYTSGVIGRIVYPFYFIQTLPALTLGIPYIISLINNKNIRYLILSVVMILSIAFFISYFPVRVNEF